MSTRIANVPLWLRLLHVIATTTVLVVASWGLLTSNPLAAVRGTPLHFLYFVNDFVVHLTIYTVLTLLLMPLATAYARRLEWLIVSLIATHAIVTELIQVVVPRRTCDPVDMVANLAGIVIGLRLLPHAVQMTSVLFELMALQEASVKSPSPRS